MAMVGFDTGAGYEARPRRPSIAVGEPAPGSYRPEPTTPSPEPTPTAPAPQMFRVQPVNEQKFADTAHRSAKYDFLRIAQRYNPQQGISDAMLKELNGLGYGTFGGQGQHMTISGITDAGVGAGLDPHDFNGDFIQNYGGGQNPNAQWAWDWFDPGASAAPSAPGATPFPMFDPAMMQMMAYGGMAPQQAPQPQAPSFMTNPAFWQSLTSLFGQQPGYSHAASPSFAGAQTGYRPTTGQNPQTAQLLSQILAALMGGA